jgi:hypothetical protein
LTELGPHYDSLNERVIPTVHNAAARRACRFRRQFASVANACSCAYFGGSFSAQEGLAAGPFWRDHEASMTSYRMKGCRMKQAGSRKT